MLQERLKEYRKIKKLSQTEMAHRLNITRQAYNHYETGKRIPPLDTLQGISFILDVSIDYLLENDSKKTSPPSEDDELDAFLQEPVIEQILTRLQKLTPEGQKAALAQLDALVDFQHNREKESE